MLRPFSLIPRKFIHFPNRHRLPPNAKVESSARSSIVGKPRGMKNGVILENQWLSELKKRWFILSLILVIIVAKTYPYLGSKEGPLYPSITVKYIAVSLIFFNSGLSLKTEELARAVGQVRLHLFIQLYTLVFIPITVTILVKFLALTGFIEGQFLKGLHVVGCMPPPVSSAVILTKAVGGNDAAAIFNSALGSFLGIFVTPLLLLTLIGTAATVPFTLIFVQLSVTVVIPLIIGQVARKFVKKQLDELNLPFGTISSIILLLIIYTTFCDTFNSSDSSLSPLAVFKVAIIVLLCQVLFLSLAFLLASLFNSFTRMDVIAVLFCSTHKSLTLGIPILKIVFGQSPDLSSMTLPLLVYHPTQILLGSFLVTSLQSWVSASPVEPASSPTSNSPKNSSPLA